MGLLRADAAVIVAEIDPVGAIAALHRLVAGGESDGVPLPWRHHLDARLVRWPLFGEDALAAGEILPRFADEDGYLQVSTRARTPL